MAPAVARNSVETDPVQITGSATDPKRITGSAMARACVIGMYDLERGEDVWWVFSFDQHVAANLGRPETEASPRFISLRERHCPMHWSNFWIYGRNLG